MQSGKNFNLKTVFQRIFGSGKIPKIICTLGTTTDDVNVQKQMIRWGMAAVRLNTAYATILQYQQRIASVKKIADIPAILDLKGSQIRLLTNDRYHIETGEAFNVGFKTGDIAFNYDFFNEISPGEQILFENGTIRTVVAEKKNHYLVLQVLQAGEGHIRNHMAANVPGKIFRSVPLLTQKDIEVIDFAVKERIEYLAISFVRTMKDINNLREAILAASRKNSSKTPLPGIIIKIEDLTGVKNLPAIIKETQEQRQELLVMIGRGDMFVEAPKYRLPFIQKEIIQICHELNTQVIVATGLLESMQFNPEPTRSEVCDVANSVFDGADWLMLSAETSNSRYPAEAVKMLQNIIEECLKYAKR